MAPMTKSMLIVQVGVRTTPSTTITRWRAVVVVFRSSFLRKDARQDANICAANKMRSVQPMSNDKCVENKSVLSVYMVILKQNA